VALANGIQRYLRENNRPEINFMQKNSPVIFSWYKNKIGGGGSYPSEIQSYLYFYVNK
jgi:hypothetical protein